MPIGTTDVPKLIESAKAALLATKTAPVMPIEASADPVKEPKSKKAVEQRKVLSPAPIIGLQNINFYNNNSKEKKNG
jgi:predicted transcriptional regulator